MANLWIAFVFSLGFLIIASECRSLDQDKVQVSSDNVTKISKINTQIIAKAVDLAMGMIGEDIKKDIWSEGQVDLDGITNLLKKSQVTLEQMKERKYYSDALDRDVINDNSMYRIKHAFNAFRVHTNHQENRDHLKNACENDNPVKVFDFYDHHFNKRGDRTLGKSVLKQDNPDVLDKVAKVFYLKMIRAIHLYSMCVGFKYSGDQKGEEQVNRVLTDTNGHLNKIVNTLNKFRDNVKVRQQEIIGHNTLLDNVSDQPNSSTEEFNTSSQV